LAQEQGYKWDKYKCYKLAEKKGYIKILEWIREKMILEILIC